MIITLQPSAAETSARFVHTTLEPPSLVINDGTTTLVLRPADLADGLADAADFAQELVQVASEWESGCRRTIATTQPDHPSDAQAPADEHDHPTTTLTSRHHTASCTIKTDDGTSGVTPGSTPKPTKRTGLVAARKAAGLTQEELAARLGVERSTVYRWESGDTTPLPMLRPGLARLLRLDDDRLATLLGEPVDQSARPRASPNRST